VGRESIGVIGSVDNSSRLSAVFRSGGFGVASIEPRRTVDAATCSTAERRVSKLPLARAEARSDSKSVDSFKTDA